MEQRKDRQQPRIFSAVNWGYATLPLMGLALPQRVFAHPEDEFSFDAAAPEPALDLIDILPRMVQHFSSTAYHMDRPGLMAGGDGSSFVVPPDADVAQDAHDAAQIPQPDHPVDDDAL